MDQFLNDMKNVCEERNLDAFMKFLRKYVDDGTYSKEMVEHFEKSCYEIQMGAYCKCICNCEDVSYGTRFWAKMKLAELGMSSDIKGGYKI